VCGTTVVLFVVVACPAQPRSLGTTHRVVRACYPPMALWVRTHTDSVRLWCRLIQSLIFYREVGECVPPLSLVGGRPTRVAFASAHKVVGVENFDGCLKPCHWSHIIWFYSFKVYEYTSVHSFIHKVVCMIEVDLGMEKWSPPETAAT